jgi:hypothetical protein
MLAQPPPASSAARDIRLRNGARRLIERKRNRRRNHRTLIIMAASRRCDPAAAAFCRRFASRSTEESRSLNFRLLHLGDLSGYGDSGVVQYNEGVWLHQARRRWTGCFCPYLGC